jgi:two-component system OmpR family sensor kinase
VTGVRSTDDSLAGSMTSAIDPRTRRTPVLGSTRLRMFVAYLLLLIVTGVIAILGIRQVLLVRLEERTDDALIQELDEVSTFLATAVDPDTGTPFETLERAFDVYLDRNVPSIEEGFVTVVGAEPFRSRLRSFPGNEIPPKALSDWIAYSMDSSAPTSIAGTFDTPFGEAPFRALRVELGADTGAFVVTILPDAGRREIRGLQTYGAAIMVGVVLLAAAFAWLLAGRVLQPVRELTETARAISRADSTRRASVGGSMEAEDMVKTFNDMLDRLDVAHAQQLEFVQAAGHELRTPLTVAIGHLELLGDDAGTAARTEVPLVLDELARMGRILDDLQSLAIANRPDFLVRAAIDAQVFGEELIAKSRALAPRTWVLGPVTDASFVGDRHRLTEAVLNLVDNAVKSSDNDDRIEISIRIGDGQVRIQVADTGVGVHPEDAERIFEKFARGGTLGKKYRGAGLGLSIVRTIAEAHGGTVDVRSNPGLGSTFAIVLPLVTDTTQGAFDDPNPDRRG